VFTEIALQEWINEQDCQWMNCTFRIGGRSRIGKGRQAHLRALRWTLGFVNRRYNGKQHLRFVPFFGGEASTEVGFHVHALLERPRVVLPDFKETVAGAFGRYALKAHQVQVQTEFWVDESNPTLGNLNPLTRYFMRYEGPQFGMGIDKLIVELLNLPSTS